MAQRHGLMRKPIITALGGIAAALCVALCMAVPHSAHAGNDTQNNAVPANQVTMTGPWARMTPMSGAIFGTLHLSGNTEDRLMSITCPDANMVELHTTEMVDGVMKMHAVEALALPPGLDIRLEPGGMHIMLMGLKEKKKPGEDIACTMRFEHAPELTFTATVRPLGEAAHTHHSFE